MILILGCGITGVSIANYLHKEHLNFKIADSRESPELLPKIKYKLPKSATFFGKWQKSILIGIKTIIISPGINPEEDIILWAKELKIPIISDIDYFYLKNNNKNKTFIGITGTNGKSTTVKILEFVLQKMQLKAIACGNIGTPVLALKNNYDFIILELSSYQLDYSTHLKLDYGLILNITPDHLDRYKTFDNYKKSKLQIHNFSKNILTNCFVNSVPNIKQFGILTCHNNQFIIFNDEVVFDFSQALIFGTHNLENILATFSICHKLSLDLAQVANIIYQFKGLEHRLEFVKTIDNADYFNDSKATNAIATTQAITAIKKKYNNIMLILGGVKKQENYSKLLDLINQTITCVILIGESSNYFYPKLNIDKHTAKNMQDVIKIASKNNKIDCVLLSPACASFDMFANFEERGLKFKEYINNNT